MESSTGSCCGSAMTSAGYILAACYEVCKISLSHSLSLSLFLSLSEYVHLCIYVSMHILHVCVYMYNYYVCGRRSVEVYRQIITLRYSSNGIFVEPHSKDVVIQAICSCAFT